MLQNETLVAKIGFDTAENGPSKVWVTGTLVYRYIDIQGQTPPVQVYPSLRAHQLFQINRAALVLVNHLEEPLLAELETKQDTLIPTSVDGLIAPSQRFCKIHETNKI